MAKSVLTDFRAFELRVSERMTELAPTVREWNELAVVADRLGIPIPDVDSARPAPAAKPQAAAPRRRGRPRTSNGRRADVKRLVLEKPGITVPEMGKALGVDGTGLYRVAKDLVADKELDKKGRGYFPRVANGNGSGGKDAAARALATA
jgi:hypothetical protein